MTTPNLVLLAYLFLIAPGMIVGFVFARRKMFVPYHKFTMTAITLVNWLLILFVMLVTYRRDVLPQVPQNLSVPTVLIPTIHLIPGLIAQLLATYLVIRMWFEKQLPAWFKVKNIKRYMRTTLGLWLLTAILGVLTWAVINQGFLAAPVASTGATPGSNIIRLVAGNQFDPGELTIPTGTTIQFVNADTRPHTVTADDGSFDSGSIKAGATFTHTFNQPGDVAYYCDFHGGKDHVGMAGMLHVTGSPVLAAATEAPTQLPTLASTNTPASTEAAGSAQVFTVVMNDDVFEPKTITIPVGSTIHFVNQGKRAHTVTADDSSFDSDQVKPGGSFDFTFTKTGDIPVYCQNHGASGGVDMAMVVHVTAAGPAAAPTQSPTLASTNTPASTEAAGSAQVFTVIMNDNTFEPKTITIPVGSTIHFVNQGKRAHTVTADDSSFDSDQVKPGGSFDFTFTKTGDIPVYCQNHGASGGVDMAMVVHVTAAGPTAAPTQSPTLASTNTPASTEAAGSAQVFTVIMNDNTFEPKTITIPVGSTIHFVNQGKRAHTVTADDSSFDSDQVKPGGSFDFTFTKTGDIPVYCQNHGASGGVDMAMVVHVTAAGPAATPTEPPSPATAVAPSPTATTASSFSAQIVTALSLLEVRADDTPNKTAYAVGMQAHMKIVKAQAAIIADALQKAHYEDAQAAAEAILNGIEGGAGKDRDGDGVINQPGDSYGLKKYIFSTNEIANTLQEITTTADPLHSAAVDMQSAGRDALKDLQTVSQQAQALLDAKTLVDARKIGPILVDAVFTLEVDLTKIIRDIPVIPGSHLVPVPPGN